jgi:hypothetical protein
VNINKIFGHDSTIFENVRVYYNKPNSGLKVENNKMSIGRKMAGGKQRRKDGW